MMVTRTVSGGMFVRWKSRDRVILVGSQTHLRFGVAECLPFTGASSVLTGQTVVSARA